MSRRAESLCSSCSALRVMTRINEVSSDRIVTCHWDSLRSEGSGGNRWFCMQKCLCGWQFRIHFEVPNHKSMLFLTSCWNLVSVLCLCCQKSSAIVNIGRLNCRKMWDFLKFFRFFKFLGGFSYTRPPRGNQNDDLPRALHMPLGQLAIRGVWRLSVILHVKMFMRLTIYDSFWGTV